MGLLLVRCCIRVVLGRFADRGRQGSLPAIMAEAEIDPFEARLAFLDILNKLSSAKHSIQRATMFALTHKEFYEDLYSCIVEILPQVVLL